MQMFEVAFSRRMCCSRVCRARAVGEVTVGVLGHPDQAARQLAGVRLAHREISRVRAAEPQRHAETLCGAEAHVRALLPRRRDQGHRQQIRPGGDQRAALVRRRDRLGPVDEAPGGPRSLHQHAEEIAVQQRARTQVRLDDLDAQRLGASVQHGPGLREEVGVDQQPVRRAGPVGAPQQGHRLRRGGRLVQHGRVGDLHAGQVRHHGLEVEQRLQTALADLGLVRGVGGVPGRILQQAAHQHRRGEGVVVAEPDHGRGDGIRPGQSGQFAERLVFGHRRGQHAQPVARRVVEDARRHGPLGQFVQRTDADGVENAIDGGGVGSDMAIGEGTGHGSSLVRAEAGGVRTLHDAGGFGPSPSVVGA